MKRREAAGFPDSLEYIHSSFLLVFLSSFPILSSELR